MAKARPPSVPQRLNPWMARAVLVAGGCLLATAMAEVALRVLGFGYGGVHMSWSDVLHHEHPREYRFVSYHRAREYGGHTVFYDEEGRRADPTRSLPEPTTADRSIAFMGDSFVEALQVAYEESFVGRLQQVVPASTVVHNYGTSSYSPALYLLQWRHVVGRQSPTHVFLMLFGNDVRDDHAMTTIGTVSATGDLLAVSGNEPALFDRLARLTYVGRLVRKVQLQVEWMWDHRGEDIGQSPSEFVEENPEITTLTDGYLERLIDEVRETGAQLVLMAVPSRVRALRGSTIASPSEPVFHDIVREWAARHDVAFVDLAAAFDRADRARGPLFFARDIHFTSEGHRVVADTLLEAFPDVFGPTVNVERQGRR